MKWFYSKELWDPIILFIVSIIAGTIIITGAILGLYLSYAFGLYQKSVDSTIITKQLTKELEYLNNANYNLQWKYGDLQHQKDMVELYLWEYGTGKITKEEMAAKVEAIEPRNELLEIKKHKLEWEK